MKLPKARPCPICGAKPKIRTNCCSGKERYYYLTCLEGIETKTHQVQTFPFLDLATAVHVWNGDLDEKGEPV